MTLLLVAALGCAAVAGSHQSAAQDAPTKPASEEALKEARVRYQRGTQLHAEGAFDAALVELQRAYELAPTPNLLYNIGIVNLAKKDFAAALVAFEKYLNDAKAIPAARRTEVQKHIEELRGRVARVRIVVNQADVDVTVDDVSVGRTPIPQPILVNVGRRVVRASKGDKQLVKTLAVAGGDETSVNFDWNDEKPAESPTVVPRHAASTPLSDRLAAPVRDTGPSTSSASAGHATWIGWLGAGVLAAGAVATGLAASSAQSSLEQKQQEPNVSRGELDDAHSKMRTLAIATDVLAATAVAVAGVTLYFTLSKDKPARTIGMGYGPPRAAGAVRINIMPAGMQVETMF